MQCYAPDPAGRANSAPLTSWLDFGERKGRVKGKKGREGKKWKGKGCERENYEGRKGEGDKGRRKGEERKKEKGKGERGGFCII